MQLNLNADLGESFGAWSMGDDHGLLGIVNTANVACGFHAGDPLVMSRTIDEARHQGVSIGAHPGFADLQGFGRRQMTVAPDELHAMMHYQLAALDGMARAREHAMTHVKPHGALNNMACEDKNLAIALASAIADYRPDLILLAPVLSELSAAGNAAGLTVALEVFADRAYTTTGALVPRNKPGALLETSEACIGHVQAMIAKGGIVTQCGSILETPFHSVCVHGDSAHAVTTAQALRIALLAAGHELLPLPVLLQT
ncbi:MAG: 5-oxoprolinase subunit PxpA [Granulosicoccus sp.]